MLAGINRYTGIDLRPCVDPIKSGLEWVNRSLCNSWIIRGICETEVVAPTVGGLMWLGHTLTTMPENVHSFNATGPNGTVIDNSDCNTNGQNPGTVAYGIGQFCYFAAGVITVGNVTLNMLLVPTHNKAPKMQLPDGSGTVDGYAEYVELDEEVEVINNPLHLPQGQARSGSIKSAKDQNPSEHQPLVYGDDTSHQLNVRTPITVMQPRQHANDGLVIEYPSRVEIANVVAKRGVHFIFASLKNKNDVELTLLGKAKTPGWGKLFVLTLTSAQFRITGAILAVNGAMQLATPDMVGKNPTSKTQEKCVFTGWPFYGPMAQVGTGLAMLTAGTGLDVLFGTCHLGGLLKPKTYENV